MAITNMYILRPTEKIRKIVCPVCVERGEVLDGCVCCLGTAIKKQPITQFYVRPTPIPIFKVDRDIKTGILRYWDSSSSFYYETLNSNLNSFIPDVPYGVHLVHDSEKSATWECKRINRYLAENKIYIEQDITELVH